MSEKKTCVACGKQIPSAALVCVFCSAKQPSEEAPSEATAGAQPATATGAAETPTTPLVVESVVSKHATDPTLVGIKASDVQAALEGASPPPGNHAAPPVNGTPSAVRPTAAMPVVVEPPAPEPPAAEPPAAEPPAAVTGAADEVSETDPTDDRLVLHVDIEPAAAEAPADPEPWAQLSRLVMGVGGLVLVALFFCPWHGVSSWQLLETFVGADFVRQLFYLTGGIVLTASALLPLPFVFRAGVGTFVAALPVLLGGNGLLDGWRGALAALAVLALPATHLLRARAPGAARLLALAAVGAVLLLYLVPLHGAVPVVALFRLIASGSTGHAVLGLFVLLPLVFAGLSLLGVLGRDLADLGVLLAVVILLWAPITVALRGLLVDDATQLYVAVALLWASATAALSLAQLLSVASARASAS